MAFDLDGLAVLGRMAGRPDALAGIETERRRSRALLTRLLKDRSTTLARARAMAATLPEGTLSHVTDGMGDAEIAALAVRLDGLNPAAKAGDRQARATLVDDLVSGRAEPATRPAKPVKTKVEAAPKAVKARKGASSGVGAARRVLQSKAMGARKLTKAAGP